MVKYRDNQCVNCAEQKYSNEAFDAANKAALLKSKKAADFEPERDGQPRR
ncbi:MAG: hypothetical protein E6X17_06160 [Sporomusaceae bacterium]|nr:hypothetical protein [Sporomusaceae bacterium]